MIKLRCVSFVRISFCKVCVAFGICRYIYLPVVVQNTAIDLRVWKVIQKQDLRFTAFIKAFCWKGFTFLWKKVWLWYCNSSGWHNSARAPINGNLNKEWREKDRREETMKWFSSVATIFLAAEQNHGFVHLFYRQFIARRNYKEFTVRRTDELIYTAVAVKQWKKEILFFFLLCCVSISKR